MKNKIPYYKKQCLNTHKKAIKVNPFEIKEILRSSKFVKSSQTLTNQKNTYAK